MNNEDPAYWLKKFFLHPLEHPFFWIVLVIFVVYLGTLFYDIVYLDDNNLVVAQYQFNKNLANIPQAFQEDIFQDPVGKGSFYRPIERLTFMFDAQFGQGAIVFMSHLSNVLLHIISICLLFILLLKLKIKKEIAFWFSLIFAIHPLTAQTVAFISGRNDSLLAIFIFPSLIFFWKYLEENRRKYFVWHLIFFALALFTKETAVILPLISASYILLFVNFKKIISEFKPYLLLLAGWGSAVAFWFLVRREVLHDFIGNADYHIGLSIYRNLPSLIPTIGKIFLPFGLSVFSILKDMSFIFGLESLALLIIWFILARNKNYKLIIFGLIWFLIFNFITLINPMDSTPTFSENRIYLPMFGFIFVVLGLGKPGFLDSLGKMESHFKNIQKKIIITFGIIIIIIFSSVTIYRNRYYADKISFWQNAVKTSPSFAFNHNNMGAMYYLDGDLGGAQSEFKKALEINPEEPMSHNNLGLVYMDRGEFQKADEEYNKELSFNPYYSVTYGNKALLYNKMGRTEDSLQAWKKVLEINPGSSKAIYNLFIYYYQKQDKENAIHFANEAQKRGVPLIPEMQKMLNPFAP